MTLSNTTGIFRRNEETVEQHNDRLFKIKDHLFDAQMLLGNGLIEIEDIIHSINFQIEQNNMELEEDNGY